MLNRMPLLTEQDMIERFVKEFLPLTEIPRPSHHEEQVGAYLLDWARAHGCAGAERDAAGNVRFDVPATPGLEHLPLTALQGHTDMVCVAAPGRDYDPLRDPIRVLRDDAAGTLRADGTSLGADDGAGVALALCAAAGHMAHGPLRLIFTADEEDGMGGVQGMDPAWLRDVTWLVNLDSESPDQVVVSTAAGDRIHFTGVAETRPAPEGTGLRLTLAGLRGGHSGMDIHIGRCNAIVTLGALLRLLAEAAPYALADFHGGKASNAIPDEAAALLIPEDPAAFKAALASLAEDLKERWREREPGICLSLTEAERPAAVLADPDRDRGLSLVCGLRNGVYTWSEDMEGLVESSSSLGVFRLDAAGMEAAALVRFCAAERGEELLESHRALAASLGYDTEVKSSTAPWPYRPNSPLLERCKAAYREARHSEIQVAAIHAGLECGCFLGMNPDLDIISFGPRVEGLHSPAETLYLDSIPAAWRLLEGILKG